MKAPWRLIRLHTMAAMVFGVLTALALSSSGARAQVDNIDDSGPVRKFVLMSSGAWGAAHDRALRGIGGTVEFSHAASGIGVVASIDAQFVKRAVKTGLFDRGAEDIATQWQEPSNAQMLDDGVVEDAVTPGNDNFINLVWNMTAINAFGAWGLGYDGAGVRVAVIDGGMCSLHPDVAPNIDVAASRSFVPGFNYDQDTGGASSFRHACHVAGIIAAADNTIGTVGVAPRATIIGCKALHGGSGSFAAIIQAILYASDPISAGGAGAHIINMSLGATFAKGGGNTGAGPLVAAMNQAVNYANSKNVLVVCSAGNNAIDMDHSGSLTNIPAQSGSAIAISATAPVGFAVGWPNGATNFTNPASYTNYGHQLVWMSAPGGDSALPGNAICSVPRVVGPSLNNPCWVFDLVFSPGNQSGSYFWAGGTSMAAPHVSGVAALIAGKYPGIAVGDLKTMLARTADDAGANGADPFHGHGFVNALRAVTEPLAAQAAASPSPRLEAAAAPSRVELVIKRNGSSPIPSISFALPSAGHARVDLFDVAGRSVAVLYNGSAAAGSTTLSWDGFGSAGQRLRQGAYFAGLTAGDVRLSRKLVLLGE